MKILFLCDRLALGGAETHIYELCRALMASGHTVLAASEGGAYAEELLALGVRHTVLPMASLSPLSLLRARLGLCRLLATERPDVVHAHARIPARLAVGPCRRMRIPLIVTAHWVFRADGWRRHLSAWGDLTLAVSEDIRAYLLREYGLRAQAVRLTRNGIDTRLFRPVVREVGAEGARIVHVSRLDRGRAACAQALIEIAPLLAESGLCHELVIVGGGDREEALRTRAEGVNRALGRQFIRMVGRQSAIAPYLSSADLFVGVSRAALEAMSCALPVILAGDEGYLSVLSEEKMAAAAKSNFCARGAPPLSPERLCRDILALLADKDACRRHGEAGRRFVVRGYSGARMAQDALLAYRTALARGRREGGQMRHARRAQPKPSFLLSGYYGAENLGDDAILDYLCTRLREEGVRSITVLSRAPRKTAARFGVRAVARSSPIAVCRAMRRADCFLLGGGNLLQNETSDRSLFYYTQLLALSRQAGCKSILLGGIGALTAAGRDRVRRALPFLDGALLRTPQDLAKLRALGGKMPSACLLPDGALFLQDMPRRAAVEGAPIVVVALSGREGDESALSAALFLSRMARREYNAQILAVGMHKKQDAPILARFSLELGGVDVLEPERGQELIAELASASLLFSSRLHPLIFAAVAGVPAIAFGKSEKISDFVAYASTCEGEAAGRMLYECRERQDEGISAFARGALERGVGEEEALSYLRALRGGEEDFSFLDFYAKL